MAHEADLGVDRWVVCAHASYHLGPAFSFTINPLKEIFSPYSEHYLGLIKWHSSDRKFSVCAQILDPVADTARLAGIVVIDGNPLDDLAKSEMVTYTMISGRL